MTVAIVGASATGKTTLERELVKHGLHRIISYTTRPMRSCEQPDVDYHFISDDQFQKMLKEDRFSEYSHYRDWWYGIAKEDCVDDALAVVEMVGLRQLKKIPSLHVISFGIKVPERERVIRMMQRGDDVMETFRRIFSDQGSFSGMEHEVDYIIDNTKPLQESVQEILTILSKEKPNNQ